MQFTEMKALRSFYTHNHFFLLSPTKAVYSLSSLPHHSPQVSHRWFHSTNLRFSADGSISVARSSEFEPKPSHTDCDTQKTPVWSVYGPAISGSVSRTSKAKSDEQERESGSEGEESIGLAQIDGGIEEYEAERTYGNVKKTNLSNAEETLMGLSDSDNRLGAFSSEETERSVKKANIVNGSARVLGIGDIVRNKKKGKTKVSWVCDNCGFSHPQWWGVCRSCNSGGTLKRFSEGESKMRDYEVSGNVKRSWLPLKAEDLKPVRLTDAMRGINELNWRIPLPGRFGEEIARVLGGGLVPGSLVLIGGDPGVGKSTLLLQMATIISEGLDSGKPAPVVYVSGEESIEQISSRADRMKIGTEELFLYSSTDIEDILAKIQPLSPRALIVDSIQTVYLNEVSGSAGGLSQVKECTSALLRFAKQTNIPVLLVGHVTKSGELAGPRVLEHIVDVVLYLEGEKCSSHRMLRAVKNRYGSTDELGVFEMLESGLQPVSNPSKMFLSNQHSGSEFLAGLAIAVVMDGSRAFLIEIQALCVSGAAVLRHVNGIQANRADMIISVLMKQAGLKIQENNVFLNVVSGITLTETAGDLAIAAAICSSFLEFPIPSGMAFIGEIGLAGELRMVPRMDKRVSTVAKLGYKKCIVPKSAEKYLSALDFKGMEIIGCMDLKEVIGSVFVRDDGF